VKPGATVSVLVNTAKEEVNRLTKKDIVIPWGGTNDVSKNASTKGLTQITYFMRKNQHTIILITVPHAL
jgi:hypothetical protein